MHEWLKTMSREDRKTIGEDVKTVQFGWPIGMPVVRKLDTHLWEVRSRLQNRTARTLFTVEDDVMVLLHGLIKKTQRISKRDLELAKKRVAQFRGQDDG